MTEVIKRLSSRSRRDSQLKKIPKHKGERKLVIKKRDIYTCWGSVHKDYLD